MVRNSAWWLVRSLATMGRLSIPLFLVGFLIVEPALSQSRFSEFVVFGDSLCDTGNVALLTEQRTSREAITGNSFIPLAPYESQRFTNEGTWVDEFSQRYGFSHTPSLLGGSNYAFAGALLVETPEGYPPSLADQVSAYMSTEAEADPDALYVIAGGGNDAREVLAEIAAAADPVSATLEASVVMAAQLSSIVDRLQSAGARHIVVWNLPDLGGVPAVTAQGELAGRLASNVASTINDAIFAEVSTRDVMWFDLYGLTSGISSSPRDFNLVNAEDACGALQGCDPLTSLYWDGIHPTSAGHTIIASEMAKLTMVPEPETNILCCAAIVVVLLVRSRSGANLQRSNHCSATSAS